MATRVDIMFNVIILMTVTDIYGASRVNRIEHRLNTLEDRINTESKFRREDIGNLLDKLENISAAFNVSAKDARCQGHQVTGEENSLHARFSHEISKFSSGWRRGFLQLTQAFRNEKKLNTKLRKDFPQVVDRIDAADDGMNRMERTFDSVNDGINVMATDLKTVSNETNTNQMQLNERAHEINELKDQVLQLEENNNIQSRDIAELKNQLLELKDTCNLKTDSSNLKTAASTSTTEASTLNNERFQSCLELYEKGHRVSGQYDVYPGGNSYPVRVFCDQDTDGGGWTVFQRRKDGSENFYREWLHYKLGFGDLDGEFWLGNEYLSIVTSKCCFQLRIDLESFDGEKKYATYNEFQIKSASEKYSLKVDGYSGNAGDALAYHNGAQFSTNDADNDGKTNSPSCAVKYTGAWWYRRCYFSDLNGRFGRMYWDGFNGKVLTFTEMKFRRLV